MQIATQKVLLTLQVFQVIFIALHDWVPLGSFNHVRAVQAANPGNKLLKSTLFSTLPFAVVLVPSALHIGWPYSSGLLIWLWVTYGLLFLGELKAWWFPYFTRPQPELVARYKQMFGSTRAFMPERNGIRPNTLHVILHLSTVATLIVLAILSAR